METFIGGGGSPDGGLEQGYLWFAGSALSAFTKSQTQATNDNGAQFIYIPTVSASAFHDLAFDQDGNLWALPVTGDQILRFPADQLTSGAPPSANLVIASTALKGPESLVFDPSGNLWVMNFAGAGVSIASIVRFDDPRSASGTSTLLPSLTITPGANAKAIAQFSQGTALAFDTAGNLWFAGVSNVLRIDHPMALQGNVTAAPSVIVSTTDAFASIAFDAAGALWITGAGGGYFVIRIDNPGALTGTVGASPAAKVHLPTGSAMFAAGMAFDADGSLWIAMTKQLLKLTGPGALTGDVSPTPAVVLGLATFPDLTSKLVIRPRPSGLPIF